MKRFLLSIVAATALGGPGSAFAADPPIYGVWVRDGHPTDKLEFYDCSGKLCARGVLPMLDGSPPPQILRSAVKTGPNNWKGDLFNPEDGKTYSGKISYDSPTQLTLTGCLVAFLCQSETWTRVSGPPKAAAAPADAKVSPKPDAKSAAKPDAKPDDKAHDATKAPSEPKGGEKGAEKGPDKAQGTAKPTGGQDAKTSKAAKPADSKAVSPKPAPKPAAKPAPAPPKEPDGEAN